MKSALVTLLAALLLVVAAPATAQEASLPDIEDEVMCVECGTVLSVSNSPVAMQERQFIRDQIAQGKSKDEIKDALVDEYGEAVLADPGTEGFNATLWVVPILVTLLALAGIVFAVRKWRGRTPTTEPELPPPLSAEDASRLDAELSR